MNADRTAFLGREQNQENYVFLACFGSFIAQISFQRDALLNRAQIEPGCIY